MFCQACGNTVNPGLSYCNTCGTRIAGEKDSAPEQMSESSFNLLVSAILAIPIAGIGIILGLLVVMKKELAFRDEIIATIALMAFVLLLVSEGGLLWLLIHRTRVREGKEEGRITAGRYPAPGRRGDEGPQRGPAADRPGHRVERDRAYDQDIGSEDRRQR